MITALQNFISKKGKFVFVLLLLLVVVSFVLYLSQGSSVFDLMSDGGREKKEFFGYDWNNPDQRRFLNVTTRAASSVGVLVSPTQEVVEKADSSYIQGLQQQMQAAFRSSPDEIDQDAMQRMFQYMQAWPNFSRDFKVREIARSGSYDTDFLDESIKTRVVLSGQADNWNFLDGSINHPSVNSQFVNFLTSIDPSLESEDNRSRALSLIGSRFGMTGSELESVLYSCFRDMLVDRIYTHRGFALPGEVEVLSNQNAFAWDGEVAVLSFSDIPLPKMEWGEFRFSSVPKNGDHVEFTYGEKELKFLFGNLKDDKNVSSIIVPIGNNPQVSAQNFSETINKSNLGIKAFTRKNSTVSLEFIFDLLPNDSPKINTVSEAVSFNDKLTPQLREFFEKNAQIEAFTEEPRTLATAMVFANKNFLTSPPPPDDARLRSYFERNRLDFLPSSKPSEDGDSNQSEIPEINFEDVVEDVRKKVEVQDLADANRESERLAKNAALDFLDELNRFSDRIRKNYSDFSSLRKSDELETFLRDSQAEQRKISFSPKEMNAQSMVLGLERRASEQRANKEPLEEVDSLDSSKFFTRSVRKARNGYLVFLLDGKVPKQPAAFAKLSFSLLCQEFMNDRRNTKFNDKADELIERLETDPKSSDVLMSKYPIKVKNQNSARASFDSLQRSIRARMDKLESSQSTDEEGGNKVIAANEKKLSNLKVQLTQLAKERRAVDRFLQGAESLDVENKWVEVERNEERVVFGFLSKVYTIRVKQIEDEQKNTMNANLEFSRGMLARDEAIKELILVHLSE